MIRIALIGGPGSGKTTLANALTASIKSRGHPFDNVSEFARDFINEHGADALSGTSGLINLLIFDEQKTREDRVPEESKGFVTDSPLFLPYCYTLAYARGASEARAALEIMYKKFLSILSRYDLVFHVGRQKEYVKDGTRRESEEFARDLDDLFFVLIHKHGVAVRRLTGTTEERVAEIHRYLPSELLK